MPFARDEFQCLLNRDVNHLEEWPPPSVPMVLDWLGPSRLQEELASQAVQLERSST